MESVVSKFYHGSCRDRIREQYASDMRASANGCLVAIGFQISKIKLVVGSKPIACMRYPQINYS